MQNPKCFARTLKDCVEKITGEHGVSQNILEMFARGGCAVRWTSPAQNINERDVGISSLVQNILCKRHNEALSPLDETGRRFCKALLELPALMAAQNAPPSAVAVNGRTLERWLLKVACARTCAERRDVPELWQRTLFSEVGFRDGWGLRLIRRIGDTTAHDMSELTISHAYGEDGHFAAVSVEFGSFQMMLQLSPHPIFPRGSVVNETKSIGRPAGVTYTNPGTGAVFVLNFSWTGLSGGEGVAVTWSSRPP